MRRKLIRYLNHHNVQFPIPISIEKIGPRFLYKGDEIWWLWEKRCWLSLSFEAYFPSLKSMDIEWDRYFLIDQDRKPLTPL